MKKRMLTLLLLPAAAVCMLSPIAMCADSPAGANAGAAASTAGPVLAPPPAFSSTPPATSSSAPAPSGVSDPSYLIVPDDVLRMDVWGEPQLTGAQLAVTSSGTVSLPFVGEIKVSGLTSTEVEKIVSDKLEEAEILADARVQISLISIHRPQARILGAVQRPCSFDFKVGDTILDAIAQGGSYAEDAMLEAATLTHRDSDQSIKIDLRKLFAGELNPNDYKLQNGDAIYIPHEDYRNKFYVFGQVYRPGQYSLKEKTDVLTAISLAGGQLPRASVRNTVVVRTNAQGKAERVKADIRSLFDKGDLTQNVALNAGDIVIVPETKTPDLSKIGQVLSAIVNVGYLGRLF